MKGIVHRCYGSPDVVSYEDLAKPTPSDDEILVKVHAASVNPLDWHYLEGTPYLVRIDGGFGKPETRVSASTLPAPSRRSAEGHAVQGG